MQTGKKMVRRIATTSMVPVAPGLLKEEKFTFHRKTQELVTWHKIWKELIINFDQTLLSYITVVNTTLEFSRLQSVPVKGKEKENKLLARLVLLLQVSLCCSFTLGRLNATILKKSHFQIDLTCHTQQPLEQRNPGYSAP